MSDKQRKAARRTRRKTQSEPRTLSAMLKSVLLALPASAAVGLLLLVITTAVLLSTKDPDRYRPAAGLVLLYLTAFIGGVLATALYQKRSPVLCGLCEGILLLIVTAIPALILQDTTASNTAQLLLLRCALPPISLGGAMLCAKKTKKRRKYRH